jgi:hypothetical protein
VAIAKIARDDFSAVENCARAAPVHLFGTALARNCRLSRIFVINTRCVMPN